MFFETLESIRLRSASLNSANHILTCDGTGAADTIMISKSGANIVVNTNGAMQSFLASKVNSIHVFGYGSDDKLQSSDSVTQPTLIDGGTGNDNIRGGGGKDVLTGGADNDNIAGGKGADNMFGGSGFDSADYFARTDRTVVTLDGEANDGKTTETNYNFSGGSNPEPSAEADNVHTDFEQVKGGSNSDWLQGSSHNDYLYGNGGNDLIEGAGGNDHVYGGKGDDSVNGSLEYEGGGSDQTDYMYGGDGDDSLFDGFGGTYYMYGDAGNDQLDALGHKNHLFGGDGNDHLMINSGYVGTTGHTIADNSVDGGKGDDLIQGMSIFGAPVDIHGGAGMDRIVYDGTSLSGNGVGVYVNLDDKANDGVFFLASEGDNVHSDVENVTGTAFNDTIIGSDVANQISAGSGDDLVLGNGGNDIIFGGKGNDILRGGSGNDKLYGQAGNDLVDGSDGAIHDLLDGGTGFDKANRDITAQGSDALTSIEQIL